MTPKKYLVSYHLGKVHKALLAADIKINTVQDIAYDCAFYHMGHFAEKYRKMFGENPP